MSRHDLYSASTTPPRQPLASPAAQILVAVVTLLTSFAFVWVFGRQASLGIVIALSVAAGSLIVAKPSLGPLTYVVIAPLIVGINRGGAIPLLRPNEALLFLILAALLGSLIIRPERLRMTYLRVTPLDRAVFLLAIAGSIWSLTSMLLRGRLPSTDDILYGFQLLKCFALYAVVRFGTNTDKQGGRLVAGMLLSSFLVGIVGLLQALGFGGVNALLKYYVLADEQDSLDINHASSTLGTSIGFGDVMCLSVALCVGWMAFGMRFRRVAAFAATYFAVAALASGQFSAIIALAVVVLVAGKSTKKLGRILVLAVPVGAAAFVALQSVLEERLNSLDHRSGLPLQWTGPNGRLYNLSEYFLPEFADPLHVAIGVQTAARVPSLQPWRQWIYIESGYMWLLWVGGIPLLGAFFLLLRRLAATSRHMMTTSNSLHATLGVAGMSATWLLLLLTLFDPHLTLRGSADILFTLFALVARFSAPNKTLDHHGSSSLEPAQTPSSSSI